MSDKGWRAVAVVAAASLFVGTVLGLSIVYAMATTSSPKIVCVDERGATRSILWRGARYDLSVEKAGVEKASCGHVWSSSTNTGEGFKPADGAACLECGAVKQ